jgi:hypothetical protein
MILLTIAGFDCWIGNSMRFIFSTVYLYKYLSSSELLEIAVTILQADYP